MTATAVAERERLLLAELFEAEEALLRAEANLRACRQQLQEARVQLARQRESGDSGTLPPPE